MNNFSNWRFQTMKKASLNSLPFYFQVHFCQFFCQVDISDLQLQLPRANAYMHAISFTLCPVVAKAFFFSYFRNRIFLTSIICFPCWI